METNSTDSKDDVEEKLQAILASNADVMAFLIKMNSDNHRVLSEINTTIHDAYSLFLDVNHTTTVTDERVEILEAQVAKLLNKSEPITCKYVITGSVSYGLYVYHPNPMLEKTPAMDKVLTWITISTMIADAVCPLISSINYFYSLGFEDIESPNVEAKNTGEIHNHVEL